MRSRGNKSKTIAILTILLALFSGSGSALASGNPWYDKYVSFDNARGGDYYQSTDSGILAWNESYMLNGYLTMYELTGSTSWLNKFTTHADTVVANASDPDGDGYLGWTSARYSPVRIVNGSFYEHAVGDTTLPANWVRWQSTSSTAYRSASPSHQPPNSTDGWSLVMITNGTSWQRLYQPLTSYEPNTAYSLRFTAKTNGSPARGIAFIRDQTTGVNLVAKSFDSTTWSDYSVDFTTPAAGHALEVWLGHAEYNHTDGVAFFDNVTVSGRFPYLVHDGMIGIPLAKFARLVDRNPTQLATYATKSTQYQTFLQNEIVPKWQSSASYPGNTWVNLSSTEGYYKESTQFDGYATGTSLNPLPHNQFLVFAEMLAILYDINGNADYLDKAQKMNTYFKNRLTLTGSTYNWKYGGYASSPVEDASHANDDLKSVLEMYNRGLIYNGTDLERFTDTLTATVWNQSTSAPKLHNYVDGTQGPTRPEDWIYSLAMTGWTQLAQFDHQAWVIAAHQYSGLPVADIGPMGGQTLTEIMKWDPVKMVNPGFELRASDDSTRASRWTRVGSTSATVYRDSVNKYSGQYGLTLVSNGSNAQTVYQRWAEQVPSATYVVTFDGKTDGSGAGGKVWAYDETTGTTLGSKTFTGTSWQSYTFTFTAPANAGDVVKLYLGHNTITVSNGKTHFDNVVIKRQGDAW